MGGRAEKEGRREVTQENMYLSQFFHLKQIRIKTGYIFVPKSIKYVFYEMKSLQLRGIFFY